MNEPTLSTDSSIRTLWGWRVAVSVKMGEPGNFLVNQRLLVFFFPAGFDWWILTVARSSLFFFLHPPSTLHKQSRHAYIYIFSVQLQNCFHLTIPNHNNYARPKTVPQLIFTCQERKRWSNPFDPKMLDPVSQDASIHACIHTPTCCLPNADSFFHSVCAGEPWEAHRSPRMKKGILRHYIQNHTLRRRVFPIFFLLLEKKKTPPPPFWWFHERVVCIGCCNASNYGCIDLVVNEWVSECDPL